MSVIDGADLGSLESEWESYKGLIQKDVENVRAAPGNSHWT